jgi:O-antigen/teichoic acid export membrane protein
VKTGWSKGVGKRVLTGFLANMLSQGGSIILQLVSIPIFLSYWSNAIYGSWLICFTLPALLSFGDLGLSTSAGNAMIHATALGRLPEAIRLFQSVLLAIGCIGIAMLIITVGVVTFFPAVLISIEGHSTHDVAMVIIFLAGYSAVSQYSGLLAVGFRSDGRYALGSILSFAVNSAENLVAIAVVIMGGKCVAVAASFFAVRALGCISLSRILALQVPWLRQGFADASMSALRGLARQSLAVLALPIAQTTMLQGVVLMVGSLLSPASVTIFVTVRTAARMGFQGALLVNHALMPEFAAVGARDDALQRSQLVVANFLGIALALVPVALILLTFGPSLIGLWTHGHVVPDRSLVAGLVAVMIVNGIWHPTSNLLLALNRQGSYAYVYVATSLVCLGLTYVLIGRFNIWGAIAANLVLDSTMLTFVFYLIFVRQDLGSVSLKAGSERLIHRARSGLAT